ncbi:hypothetical protein BJX96DRAFT_158185 [Aspergillus floccosus]
MPPGRPVSPLSPKTYSPPPSSHDIDEIVGSDEELDEAGRVAQRQRIQKLADAYNEGKPLFILSASLRGPFDNGWVNPWKKDRRRRPTTACNVEQPQHQKRSNSPVVDETNPRKRRQHHGPGPRNTRPSPSPARPTAELMKPRPAGGSHPHTKALSDKRNRMSVSPSTAKRTLPWMLTKEPSPLPYQPTPVRHSGESWLKKDRKKTGFQTIDPPTSPTTSISSRHFELKNRPTKLARTQHQPEDSNDTHGELLPRAREGGALSSPRKLPGITTGDKTAKGTIPRSSISTGQRSSPSFLPKDTIDANNPGNSLYVLSSQSHLPKFEFRRRLRIPSSSSPQKQPFAERGGKDESGAGPTLEDVELENRHGLQEKPQLDQDAQESATMENDSNTLQNTFKSDMGHSRTDTNPTGAHMSERMPSAQQVSGAPTMTGYVTSLHSTAAPKSNSDKVTIPDPQFSTQAALLVAQRSFQDDLESPEHVLAASQRQAHSPPGKGPALGATITPFRQLALSTTTKETDNTKAPDTSRDQMLSTQYMLNAATPFAFSTEKKSTEKVDYGLTSLKKPIGGGKQKATSFEISTPSLGGNALEPLKSGIERVPDSMPRRSPEVQGCATETQPSALPMTLTGTTPPTAQDGQGGYPGPDSFNLTQAIAEAGSWLQQSFDFTKDLQQCKDKSQPPASQATRRSAFGVDIPG